MIMLDERENAFEAKYAHDQELQFKLIAKRNKLLALWAAALLGKEGDAVDAYVLEVIKSDFEETGDDDVMRKVATDLVGTEYDEKEVRKKMDAFLSDVMNEEE
ncbi:MAG: DUF1476 domain-containing protein [Phycisphaerae bacterium]|nr:DUF1476 domain-containing protein [Phycisphaerae bacterium]MBT6282337.1 DUF1476 domain-containing protein [Phycisphaerae bacterium]